MSNTYPNFGYSHYTTIILQVGSFRDRYLNRLTVILNEFNLGQDDEEPLYDWLVSEALSKLLNITFLAKLDKHYRHDIYKCVYDKHGFYIEQVIAQQIQLHQLHFLNGQRVKSIVAGESIIIVRGVNHVGF